MPYIQNANVEDTFMMQVNSDDIVQDLKYASATTEKTADQAYNIFKNAIIYLIMLSAALTL